MPFISSSLCTHLFLAFVVQLMSRYSKWLSKNIETRRKRKHTIHTHTHTQKYVTSATDFQKEMEKNQFSQDINIDFLLLLLGERSLKALTRNKKKEKKRLEEGEREDRGTSF